MKKTVLVIGDPMMNSSCFEPSLKRFVAAGHIFVKRGIWHVFITYDDVMHRRLPDLRAKRTDILLFFPYNYWNASIEIYTKDARIYGDINFGRDYELYLKKIDIILRHKYKDKHLKFINPPQACIIDRDKLKTYNILKNAGIDSPRIFEIKTLKQFYGAVERYGSLYIKPRFGAMGKGISFADHSGVYTNFTFKSGRIAGLPFDYNWKPVMVPKAFRDEFISLLLKQGFIFQQAVKPLVRGHRRFDIRVYAAFKKVPYLYAKSAPLESFLTNWSQGGRIENSKFLSSSLSRKELATVKQLSLKAADAIGLSFAGVDIIIDRKTRKTYVLEIQSFPGYERGFDLMKFMAKHI